MHLTRAIANDAAEPVTLAEMQSWLDLPSGTDAGKVATLIASARAHAERVLERALASQTVTLSLDAHEIASPIWLPFGPVSSVTSVATVDEDGTTTTLTEGTHYQVVGSDPARLLHHTNDLTTFEINRREDVLRITYAAGHASRDDVPEEARTLVKMLTERLYEGRLEVAPHETDRLLQMSGAEGLRRLTF